MGKFALARLALIAAAAVFGFIALILHTVFATHEHVGAPGLPPGEHINGALAGYGLSGVILLLFVTAFDFAIQHFGWRKYIAFWWIGALFGFFLLLLTTGALAVVYLTDGLGRATLAFDILLGLIHFAILILQCADDPIAQVDKNYGEGIDSFLGCLVTQLEATGINNIVQILLIFLIPVMAFVSFILSCINAHNGRSQQDGLGITGLLTVLASSALGVWRWTSFRNTSEYLFQWQLITLLGFYLLALAVGAWMVPSNLAGLDTAVLVFDTLIVLALLLRLLTTLESPSDYEQIGGNGESGRINAPPPAAAAAAPSSGIVPPRPDA